MKACRRKRGIAPFILNLVPRWGCRSQWPPGLRRRSTVARLLRSWVRIPPEAWMSVCCECCVLLGRGLCDEMITRPEESYRLWCVVVCDLETSTMRRPWPALGRSATEKKNHVQTDSGIQPSSCADGGTGDRSLGVTRTGRGVEHRHLSRVKFKNEQDCTCISLYAFMACCKETFTFTFTP